MGGRPDTAFAFLLHWEVACTLLKEPATVGTSKKGCPFPPPLPFNPTLLGFLSPIPTLRRSHTFSGHVQYKNSQVSYLDSPEPNPTSKLPHLAHDCTPLLGFLVQVCPGLRPLQWDMNRDCLGPFHRFNKVPQPGTLLNNRSGGWKSEMGCQERRVLGTAIFWVAHGVFLLCPHIAESRGEASSLMTLLKALLPFTSLVI